MIGKANLLFVTFLGSGLFPKAPGTMGTLATVIVVLITYALGMPISVWLMPVFFLWMIPLYIASCLCTDSYMKTTNKHDPKEVVIDETIGICVTYAIIFHFFPLLYENLSGFTACIFIGFVLFRLFDILKPFPVSYADSHMNNAHGVILDDLLAGVYAGLFSSLILFVIYSLF